MKSFWNVKILVICAVLICGIVFLSYLIFERAEERSIAEHAKTVLVQAERGDTAAESELGHLYFRGLGVAKDYSQAASWTRKAADKGDAKAQYGLGYMYWFGQGVPKDPTEAAQWYRKAADQGEARAQTALGSSYYYGQGVLEDRAIAAGWYRKAADQGVADAQYDLGYMLYYGIGIAQDRAEADRLFHQAAAQGNVNAQRTLRMRLRILSIWTKAQLFLTFGGGFLLLIGSLQRPKRIQNRGRRVIALAGLFTLAYEGLDLLRYFDIGIYPFSSAETTLLFARNILGGVSVAMLFPIVITRNSTKVVMVMSCATFIVFNFIVFIRYGLLHRAPTIQILVLGFGWFLGMSITSAILFWSERRSNGDSRSGGAGPTASESVSG